MNNENLRILCFIDWYLPGSLSGGPVRTLSNMVAELHNKYDFYIVCMDRDLSDTSAYAGVKINEWNDVGEAKVFYLRRDIFFMKSIYKILRSMPHDVLYFNSFFSLYFTTLPLFIRKYFKVSDKPFIIAPRGEFSSSALSIKRLKKSIFRSVVRLFNFHGGAYWHASSDREAIDILKNNKLNNERVYTAMDVTPSIHALSKNSNINLHSENNFLKLVFISRVSPMKNLDFLLKVLRSVTGLVRLDIVGPKEDIQYWHYCENLLKVLPHNISIVVSDPLPHDLVGEKFSQYDLFAFPTRGENFGHVIYESLLSGTPVIVSDQTPWSNDVYGGLTVVPLNETDWIAEINRWAEMPVNIKFAKREAALIYSKKYGESNSSVESTCRMFNSVVDKY